MNEQNKPNCPFWSPNSFDNNPSQKTCVNCGNAEWQMTEPGSMTVSGCTRGENVHEHC